MSITARTPEAAYSASANNLTCNVPAGTTDGDLMLCVVMLYADETVTSATGWTLVDEFITPGVGGCNWYIYRRIASSEPANYNFTFSEVAGPPACRMVIGSFLVANLNAADPIAAYSTDQYSANDAYVKATYTPPYAGMDSIFIGCAYNTSATRTFSSVTNTGGSWTETYDAGENTSDFYQCFYTYIQPESGAILVTGTMNDSVNYNKFAWAIALNVPKTGKGFVMMF